MTAHFDLSSFSAEVREQGAGIECMMTEDDQLQGHISSRRRLLTQQRRADEIKAQLCDKLRAEKMAVPGLDARVRALEVKDPEMFKYIRMLEFVQAGIWCPSCHVIKSIGGAPTKEVSTVVAKENQELKTLNALYKNFEEQVTKTTGELLQLDEDYRQKMAVTDRTIMELKKTLITICDRAYKLGVSIGVEEYAKETEESAKESAKESTHDRCDNLNRIVRNRNCDIGELLAKKLESMTMSSADLLN